MSDVLFGYENGSSIAYRLLYYSMARNNINADKLFIDILHSLSSERINEALKDGIPEKYFISIAGE